MVVRFVVIVLALVRFVVIVLALVILIPIPQFSTDADAGTVMWQEPFHEEDVGIDDEGWARIHKVRFYVCDGCENLYMNAYATPNAIATAIAITIAIHARSAAAGRASCASFPPVALPRN